MRPVKLYLLTALHDHLLRLGEAEHIVKIAYLVIAREIVRTDLRDRRLFLISDLCERLKLQVHEGDSINNALSYVWVYDDIRGEMYIDNAARVVKLIERITDNFYPADGGTTSQSHIQSTILDTLYEVVDYTDCPVMVATDYDLMRFRVWFTGDMEDPELHERWCHCIEDIAEWDDLLKRYPSTHYLWRNDHSAFIPENIDGEYHDVDAFWKNITIRSLDKLYVDAKERLCDDGDSKCELYIATH